MQVIEFFKENFERYKKISILYCIAFIGILFLPVLFLSKLFLILSISNFIFCLYYFKNIFNLPGIFMSMLFLQIGCSQAKLTKVEQDDFHLLTWLTLIVAIVIFYVCSFFIYKLKKKDIKVDLTKCIKFKEKRLFIANIIFLVFELFVYGFVYAQIGTLPAFSDEIRAFILPNLIGNIGMTVLSLPLFFIIINSVYCIIKKQYKFMTINLLYIMLLVTLGSRICIFISTFTVVFFSLITMYFEKDRKKELLVVCTSIVTVVSILMVSIPLIRTQVYNPDVIGNKFQISSGNNYYSNIYYDKSNNEGARNSSDQGSDIEIPSFLLPVWVNFSTELHGFNGLVENLLVTGNYSYGKMFLTGPFNFITKHFIEKPDFTDALKIPWINVCTFLQEPYLDFGIFGVAVFVFIFSTFGMILYVMAIKKNSLFIMIYYSYIAMCTVFFIFANHFYYSTFIVNTVLLYLLVKFFTNDKISINIKRKKT